MGLWALCLAAALAQQDAEADGPLPDPVVIPSAGLAAESGPGLLWVNPALGGYDPDPRWGVFVDVAPGARTREAVSATAGIAGLGAGLRVLRRDGGPTDFTLDLAGAIPLPQRVNVGFAARWNLLSGRRNHVAFDAALAWRPLPWLGLAAVTRRIGRPGDADSPPPQTGLGVAFRPAGRLLVLGLDYLHTFGGPLGGSTVQLSARVRPTSGLLFRAFLDSRLTFGGGFELAFGGGAIGVHASDRGDGSIPAFTAWVASEERDEQLAPPRRAVSAIDLRDPPPYTAARSLLGRAPPTWLDTLETFARTESDPTLRGVLVTLGDGEMSWARWEELRDAFRRLRAAGKIVVVHLRGTVGDGALFAASGAARVLVHPATTVRLTGPSAELFHLRGLLDAVGIGVQVVRRADDKIAAESLTETEPSASELLQRTAALEAVLDELVAALAQGRGRDPADAREWVEGGPYDAAEAERIGLVDGRAYPDQLHAELAAMLGGKVRIVDLAKRPEPVSPWEPPEEIAVVHITGPLVDGRPPALALVDATGSDEVLEVLARVARDPSVRAVVLRIDSPGGSAFAADEIWRAVGRVRASGKPVVASLGGVAASGGYYIAAAADAIWAEPTTLTGSIGVLVTKTNVRGLLDTLGVQATVLRTGRASGLDALSEPWDLVQLARIDAIAQATYDRFLDRVAVGRRLTVAEVERVARGRVWTGREAVEHGLVDEIGGLPEALRHAAALAGLPPGRAMAWTPVGARPSLTEVLTGGLLRPPRLAARASGPESLLRAVGAGAPASLWLLGFGGDEHTWLIDPWLLDENTR